MGRYIQSLEDETAAVEDVWFGPIKIDGWVKQILMGVLSAGHTSLPVFVVKEV